MQREQIVFVGTSDLSGHFRGMSFPAADLPARLQRGVGLAPTNIFVSAFGPIHVRPFGTQGEVFLVPDPETRVCVPYEGSATEYFFLGDIRTLEGAPWDFCPRHALPEPDGASNGTHIHFSFLDDDRPVFYDEREPLFLSPLPDGLAAALTLFESSEAAAEWMGADLHSAYGASVAARGLEIWWRARA